MGLLAALAAAVGACTEVPVAEPEPDLVVDLGVRHQVLEGFGASVAWYQGMLTAHAQADAIYEHAFAELGLDILRFRNRYQRSQEDSDLSAEVTVLERATASLGHPPRVLLSSWSPSGALKASGVEDCRAADGSAEARATNRRTCTLIRDDQGFAYEALARHFADTLEHYRAAGIRPTWFSLQNEPDFTPDGWEGCRFEPAETSEFPGYGRALAAVAAELEARGDTTALLGPEPQGVHYEKVENYLAELDVELLSVVGHHLYEMGGDGVWDWKNPGPDSYTSAMRGAARAAAGLPVFQTEFQTDEDEGIYGGFETAWLIHNSLVEEGVAAFLYWDLVWPRSGLIALQGDDYELRDQYYAVRHFARHTEPGDQRVRTLSTVPGLRSSAFVSAAADRLTVVLLNTGAGPLRVVPDLAAYAERGTEVFQTSFDPGQSQRWLELGALPEALELPPRSVTTVVAR